MPPRFFTPEQANEALATVRPLVASLVDHRAEQLTARARLAELGAVAGSNGHAAGRGQVLDVSRQVEEAEAGVAAALAGLTELGVVVKDVDAGLVDFPSVRDGREVFLCWQHGEEAVRYWHGVDDGFAGRRPL